ncbi:ArnT family glycosyltransferase [Amycolatopsis sp. NPDC059027]|uniref:ArnT family glycosyltransferase n=1 Tax=unclassified Amycolatopsis TaxID=2618356 RepID=UPI003671805B
MAVVETADVRQVVRGEGIVLGVILLLALVLWGWAPAGHTLQPYYVAAVHSMSQNVSTFFFGGFDPAGVVTVDKPPLAFWTQTVGVWAFGFHPWVIAGVQALEGVGAVLALNRVVRRWAGPYTALLAAALYALTPIVTAVGRDNLPDTLLTLLLVIGAYFLTRAIEETSTRWLVLAGVFAGLGFLTKMLVAWIVLPAFAVAYFVGAGESRGRRLAKIGLAGLVTLAVSLSWPVLVGVWPGAKPFVGSTTDGSVWQLVFGYNGLARLFGDGGGISGAYGSAIGADLGGAPGPLRLVNAELGGQIAWLLPLALAALVVAAFRARGATRRVRAGWTLWGGWLLVGAAVFSFTGGIFHGYYTAELAPAIAALAAAGLTTAWRWHREGGRARFVLPAAVAGTALTAYVLLDRTPTWLPWLRYTVLALGALAVISALVRERRARVVAVIAGLPAIVAGPAAYAVETAARPITVLEAGDPTAGPAGTAVLGSMRTLVPAKDSSDIETAFLRFIDDATRLGPGQAQILDYARAQAPAARITMAVEGGSYGADPFLLHTDARVAPLGGYLGFDPAPTVMQLRQWVDSAQLRFVLLPQAYVDLGRRMKGAQPSSGGAGDNGTAAIGQRIGWLTKACVPVPAQRIGPDAAGSGILFDCVRR